MGILDKNVIKDNIGSSFKRFQVVKFFDSIDWPSDIRTENCCFNGLFFFKHLFF